MHEYLVVPERFRHLPVTAFFTTKQSSYDLRDLVVLAGVDEGAFYLPLQKHTDIVQIVETDLNPQIADAVITCRTGLLIGVQTADCVPLLVCDPKRRVVAAIHAGWRSTAAGILKKALAVFTDRFYSNPSDIFIAIGPAICDSCYEVGSEVIDGVTRATGPGDYFFERGSKYHLDLRAANRQQAMAMGVPAEHLWVTTDCTCCLPEKYYSYRYAKGVAGRLYSCIALKN